MQAGEGGGWSLPGERQAATVDHGGCAEAHFSLLVCGSCRGPPGERRPQDAATTHPVQVGTEAVWDRTLWTFILCTLCIDKNYLDVLMIMCGEQQVLGKANGRNPL